MAVGTTTIAYVGAYDLKNDNTWKARTSALVGTFNSNATKCILVFKFTIPTKIGTSVVSSVSKLGFWTTKRTDGIYANNYTGGHGLWANSADQTLKFFISSSNKMTWAQLSKGIGFINTKNLNDGSQAPMSSTSPAKISGNLPSPTQFTVSNITPGNTYYLFIFAPSDQTGYSQRAWRVDSEAVSYGRIEFTYTSYTKCSAPTSIQIANLTLSSSNFYEEAIFKPVGDKARIKWSGAKNGTTNKITKYKIYWQNDTPPTLNKYTNSKTVTLNAGTTEGETDIDIEHINRGSSVYFRIQAIGSVSGYDSDLSSACLATINTLLPNPIITIKTNDDAYLVEKKGGELGTKIFSITKTGIKVEKPIIEEKIKNYEVYYTQDNGNRTKISEAFSINLNEGQATTLQFEGFDGLEYGDPTKITVKRNSRITITNITDDYGRELAYYDSDWQEKKSIVIPKVKISSEGGYGNSNNYYTYTIQSKDKTVVFNSASNNYAFDDLRIHGVYGSYTMLVKKTDGIDESNTLTIEHQNWNIPSNIEKIEQANKYNTERINSMINNGIMYFSKELSFYFPVNETYNYYKIFEGAVVISEGSLDINNIVIKGGLNLEAEAYYCINLDSSNFLAGNEFSYDIELYYNDNYITTIYTHEYKLHKIDSLPSNTNFNFTVGWEEFKPYTEGIESVSKALTFATPGRSSWASYGIIEEECRLEFSFNSNPSAYIERQFINQGESSTPESVIFVLRGDELYGILKTPTTEQNSFREDQFQIRFYNVFNEEIIMKSNFFTISYQENPAVESVELYTKTGENDNKIDKPIKNLKGGSNNDSYYLKEGSELYINAKINTYNSNPKIDLIVTRTIGGWEQKIVTYSDLGDLVLVSNNENPTPGKPLSFVIDGQILKIEESLEGMDYVATFQLRVYTDATVMEPEEKYSYYYNYADKVNQEDVPYYIDVKRHNNSIGSIKNSSYTIPEDGSAPYISFDLRMRDFGLDTLLEKKNITYIMEFRTPTSDYGKENEWTVEAAWNDDDLWKATQEKRKINFNFGTYPSGYIRLKIITTLTDAEGYLESTKEYITSEIPVYNISPTVAYRQNYLGINTRNFKDDETGVIYVSDNGNRRFIIFQNINEIDRRIDIAEGNIYGFIIDGGSWD